MKSNLPGGGEATGLHSGWFNVKSTASDNQ